MIVNGALNLLLVFFVSVAVKNRPYVAALLFASIKALLSFFLFKESASRMQQPLALQIGVAVAIGCACAAVATAFMYFMSRLIRPKKGAEEAPPSYSVGTAEKLSFRWEVIPLVLLLLVLLIL